MDRATFIREKVFQALSGFAYGGAVVPIFDELVNPAVPIPAISGADEVYIILQDQNESYSVTQTVCDPRFDLNLTIRVVTAWGLIGSKKVCEEIGDSILNLIRTSRGESKIEEIKEIELVTAQSIAEYSDAQVSFSKVLNLNFVKNG